MFGEVTRRSLSLLRSPGARQRPPRGPVLHVDDGCQYEILEILSPPPPRVTSNLRSYVDV